jgi:adenosylcobinamide-GDP ribazoletransferase
VAEEVSRDLRPWTVIVGITLTIALAAIAWPLALPMLGVAAAITLLAGLYLRHRLGGITGDTLGAVNVIVEVASLAIAQVLK